MYRADIFENFKNLSFETEWKNYYSFDDHAHLICGRASEKLFFVPEATKVNIILITTSNCAFYSFF